MRKCDVVVKKEEGGRERFQAVLYAKCLEL